MSFRWAEIEMPGFPLDGSKTMLGSCCLGWPRPSPDPHMELVFRVTTGSGNPHVIEKYSEHCLYHLNQHGWIYKLHSIWWYGGDGFGNNNKSGIPESLYEFVLINPFSNQLGFKNNLVQGSILLTRNLLSVTVTVKSDILCGSNDWNVQSWHQDSQVYTNH